MDTEFSPYIRSVRKFNRFYTNMLGLMDRHLLDTDFSLSEVRVLYEIGHMEACTSKKLIDEIKIDAGYLSRILKQFEKLGLIYREQSPDDGRLYFLYLSKKGNQTLSGLEVLSDGQIYNLISDLPENARKDLVQGMSAIERILAGSGAKLDEGIAIRSELRPGDIGTLISLHGWIYERECGYNHVFEGYVCKTFYDFMEHYSPEKDRFWFAELNGEMVGAIAVVGHTPKRAQLRWFIVHPALRCKGVGRIIFNEALQYCRDKGYKQVFLETTDDQKTAIHMYTKAGFKKVNEYPDSTWGVQHLEQTYELEIE